MEVIGSVSPGEELPLDFLEQWNRQAGNINAQLLTLAAKDDAVDVQQAFQYRFSGQGRPAPERERQSVPSEHHHRCPSLHPLRN